MATDDRNFDDLIGRFRRNIYDSPKGQLRLSLCWRELLVQCPRLAQGPPLKVWDAGGGLGQMTLRLAEHGHQMLYSDLSGEMVAVLQQQVDDLALTDRVTARQGSIQQMAGEAEMVAGFDLIVCHAVLEWVADAEALLTALRRCLKPGGRLSLMFYNLNALVLSNLSKGNLYKLRDEDFGGHPGGLTPPAPQRPHEVMAQLEALGLKVEARRGIRLAYDLMPRALRSQRSLEDVEAIDWQYGSQEPFWALGRYVHLLCRLPEDDRSGR